MSYQVFLENKRIIDKDHGFDQAELHPILFPFQRDIVRWALRRGRAAIFADCGLGKTYMQLEWARHIQGNVLIVSPLAVAEQTIEHGLRLGMEVNHCRKADDVIKGINITNYEMLHRFDPSFFEAVVLDESSILKSYSGKVCNQIISMFRNTPYKLACTATPSPNDFMELGNHSSFLNIMSRSEMLATFFCHDGAQTSQWRIKGHAEEKFWEWVSSWGCIISKPSDLGYDDQAFILPKLFTKTLLVEATHSQDGYLFPLPVSTLSERRAARRGSIGDRVKECVKLIEQSNDQWLIWCDLNDESKEATRLIDGAVEITGSHSLDYKETAMMEFAHGKIKVLVTKPSIAGFGMNWQNCHNVIFLGLSDSYEAYYQAIRRCWRFGQKQAVNCYLILSDIEETVLYNIQRKHQEVEKMSREVSKYVPNIIKKQIRGASRMNEIYETKMDSGDGWTMYLGDCVEIIKEIKDDSVHFSIFSPPFASLYTYSNSERDMGNSRTYDEFGKHFSFLVKELYRVIMPGRLVAVHCMNLPIHKERDGYIGIRDFRGDLIRAFQSEGWIYHSEVCIWKDPVTAMQRTKALGLLHKQIKKDSCMSRMGIPDYVIVMRKPGENPEKVSHTSDEFPVSIWQNYASPVWFDINPSDTLQRASAREEKDERHIAPLQLQVIERCLELWSNPGDIVLSPFAGIGSEGYKALEMARRFVGIELKPSYYKQAVLNLQAVKEKTGILI